MLLCVVCNYRYIAWVAPPFETTGADAAGGSLSAQANYAPPPPPSITPCVSSPWCSTLGGWVDGDGRTSGMNKFMQLWGHTGWSLRRAGEAGCWTHLGGASFFEDVLRGTRCDINWLEGAHAKPVFGGVAPALLGLDSAIWSYCSNAMGIAKLDGFSQEALASRCVRSGNNILRLLGGTWKWNMCQNLAWQVCAATGKLPGQAGQGMVRFATAPNALTEAEWSHPTSWPCDGGRPCPAGKYAVGDVFFAEVAVYRYICRHAEQLFTVGVGEVMTCDVDEKAFRALAVRLMAS